MARAGRVRTPDRQIAELPVHCVDAEHPSRTICGEPLAQTTPEAWEDVPEGNRCQRCSAGR